MERYLAQQEHPSLSKSLVLLKINDISLEMRNSKNPDPMRSDGHPSFISKNIKRKRSKKYKNVLDEIKAVKSYSCQK